MMEKKLLITGFEPFGDCPLSFRLSCFYAPVFRWLSKNGTI